MKQPTKDKINTFIDRINKKRFPYAGARDDYANIISSGRRPILVEVKGKPKYIPEDEL